MEKGLPLYLSSVLPKYICENKPSDICLAENETRAVVVVVIQAEKHLIHNVSFALEMKVPGW